MESKDYPEIDRLMKELHELHVKGRPDLYTELEHPYSKEEVEKIVDDPETIAIVSQEEGKVTGLCIGTLRKKSGMVEMRTLYMDDLVVDKRLPGKRHRFTALPGNGSKREKSRAKRLDLMVWEFNEGAESSMRNRE